MPTYPTMTAHEACEALRVNHIPCSERNLIASIVAGRPPFNGFAFSFAAPLALGENESAAPTRNKICISRKKFYDWLSDFIGEQATVAYPDGMPCPATRKENT